MAFDGRVEARITVPSSVTASVATGGQTASQAVSMTAGNYYWTQAGGVSSLLTTLQSELNNNIHGYPTSAALMQAAVGYGTWTAGYLCNEASGNLAAAFGSPATLTATSLTYGTGPRGGIDKAIGFDAITDNADGGNVFDITATDDLIIAWVGYLSANPTATRALVSKFTSTGWTIQVDSAGVLSLTAFRAGPTLDFQCTMTVPLGAWYVGIAVIDRGTGKARIGVRTLAGSTTVSTEATATAASYTTAANFRVGQRADTTIGAATESQLAALWAASGSSVATGLSANLSTALTNLANAINASWSLSISTTTGLASIAYTTPPAGIPSWSLDWTSADLRDLLGFPRNINYATTAAGLAAQIGYGTWTAGAGYLCNESSGNLAAAFGSPASLVAASTPTYSNVAPRGGADRSVGFDSANDRFAAASSSSFDIGASDDLAIVMVAKFSSVTGNNDILAKGWPSPGYFLARETTNLQWRVGDGVDNVTTTATVAANVWYVIICALDRAAALSRVAVYELGSGTTSISSSASTSAVGSMSNASFFAIGDQSFYGTGNLQIAALYVASGSGVAAGIPANLSTALSNFAATFAQTQTGTMQCRGIWRPDCPLNLDGDPKRAPLVSDLRQSVGPTGQVLGLVGNTFKRHKNIVWSHVPIDRVWENETTTDYASWEWFYKETQLGLGLSWFPVNAALQIYYSDAGVSTLVGGDDNAGVGTAGWSIVGLRSVEPMRSSEQWTGLWRIEIPELIAVGS